VILEGRSWSTQTDWPDHNSTLQLLGSAQLAHMAPIHPLWTPHLKNTSLNTWSP
jgi:hypothetical protein